MNEGLLVASTGAGWLGLTSLLRRHRWFARQDLTERLRPYAPGVAAAEPTSGLRDELLRWADEAGEKVAGWVGIGDDLRRRLERVHEPLDRGAFRARQVGGALLGLAAAAVVAAGLRLPPQVALAFALGGPIIGFLVPEWRLSTRGDRWQAQLLAELPVAVEQLSMLLGAGWSLGSALRRVSARGSGAVAKDLERVDRLVRNGASEEAALRAWAEVARVPAIDRLVRVLVLNRTTSDLGRLVSQEAALIRRDAQRRLVVTAERRNQQVWIPVTVAALVPGVLFLAIPFAEALRAFGG